MKYRKVLFVHVPKTGGTSITSFLQENNLDPWIRHYPAHHDPYFILQKNNTITPDIFSFAVVRNPYTRTYSYYKHFNYQNNLDVSFSEFLNFILEKRFFPKTPMILYPQNFYLFDINKKISLTKIYHFENLSEFEFDFRTKLPHLRVGSYNEDEYYEDYSKENIELVNHLYDNDFKILNYSKSLL